MITWQDAINNAAGAMTSATKTPSRSADMLAIADLWLKLAYELRQQGSKK